MTSFGTGVKRALLIGVDSYAALQDSKYDHFKLHGISNDVADMKFLLNCSGYEDANIKVLNGSRADLKTILATMNDVTKSAQTGDEIVFYFSGRGSVAPRKPDTREGENSGGNEPTLAPYDADLTSPIKDLRMTTLENWAKKLKEERGCAVDVVLDCSFAAWQGRSEQRHYVDNPKTLPLIASNMRPYAGSGVRDPIFAYPGVACACASDPGGKAYEWRKDFETSTWQGAFTDYFVGLVVEQLRLQDLNGGRLPSMAEVISKVRGYFQPLGHAGYMPGMGPSSLNASVASENDHPIFCKFEVAKPTQSLRAEIKRRSQARREAQSRLRLAVDFEDTGQEYNRPKLIEEVKNSDLIEGIKVVGVGEGKPDRILRLKQSDGKITGLVLGAKHDEYENIQTQASRIDELLKGEVGNYLQIQALSKKIWSEIETSQANLGFDASCLQQYNPCPKGQEFDQVTHPPEQLLNPKLLLPKDAYVYALTQYDTDETIDLLFPNRKPKIDPVSHKVVATVGVCANLRTADISELPQTYLITDDEQVPRTTEIRFLFVPYDQPNLDLPSLSNEDRPVLSRIVRHLRVLLKTLKDPAIVWQSISRKYKVVSP